MVRSGVEIGRASVIEVRGKKICYKPPLGKDQAERMRKGFNAKKVSQGTHVLEGKPLGK